jgi:4-hydroxy-tetrahydrodipicolinate synthase
MDSPRFGVFAALVTPIDPQGRPDEEAFVRVIEFVVERGIDGVVIGGGTAEYPHFTIEERSALISQAVRRTRGERPVIASIGTSSIHSTVQLARCAADSGADVLLIPMPHFFRYEQEDLISFCDAVCGAVSLPCWLYNLPSFTAGVTVESAIRLLHGVPNLVGMKDSSGDRSYLQPLAEARAHGEYAVFVGDDSLLFDALHAGWNGVVSGIACFAPELIRAVYDSYKSGDVARSRRCQDLLDEVIERIVELPIPWGVRVGLAARGVANGPMHVPPSPRRAKQTEELGKWLAAWTEKRGMDLQDVWKNLD